MLVKKKWSSLFALLVIVSLLLSACATPTAEVIEKVVTQVVTQVVKETVKETVIIEGTPQVVEKEITKVVEVEKVITATPEPITVQKGGTVIEASFSDAENLNPVLWTDNVSSKVGSMLYNSLVDIDPDNLNPIPDLATSWDISDDSLTFTFHLRDDVTWHDGAPFTANDVKFTYEAMLNEDINSIRRAGLVPILTPEQIVVLDDYTIEFQLSQVDAAFLTTRAIYGIIPQHILGELTPEEFNAAEFNTTSPIGTGPFIFREWVKADHIAVVRNPNYFDGAPNIDFWYLKILEDAIVEFAQLQTGEVDYSDAVTSSVWEEALAQEHLICETFPQFAFTFYIYQMDAEKSPLFLDVRTRQALLYAMDREAMVESIIFGLGEVAKTVMPPISWAYNPDNEPTYSYDVEKAKELLDEAGWKDEDGDGIREAHGVIGVEDGTPFSFEIHTNAGNTEREQVIVAFQQFWAKVGVEAQPTTVDFPTLLAMLTETYEFDMIVVGFGWGVDPDQKTMWHTDSYGGGFNMNTYSNARMDEILDAALLTTDQEKRKEYYYEMQAILAQDVPAPILYFKDGLGCHNKRLHEIYINDIDNYLNAQEWWVER